MGNSCPGKLHAALQKIQKTRLHSIDFCHFWRYNENTYELIYFFNVNLKEEQENGKKNEDHGR